MSANSRVAEISGWISEWLEAHGSSLSPDQILVSDANYLDEGLLDSIQMIEFIMDVETRFRVRLTSNVMRDPRFATLSGVTAVIDELMV